MYCWEIVEIAKKVRQPRRLPRTRSLLSIIPCKSSQLFWSAPAPSRTGSTVHRGRLLYSPVLLLTTAITEPYIRRSDDYFALLCNFSLVVLLFFSLVLKVGVLSEEARDAVR